MHSAVYSLQLCWFLYSNKFNLLETIKWIGSITMMFNVMILIFYIPSGSQPYIYGGFALAHCFWIYASYKTQEWALFWQSAVFIPANIYAILIRL